MHRKVIQINGPKNKLQLDCFHIVDRKHTQNIGDVLECPQCSVLDFPDSVRAYKRSKTFTQDTVPKGLQNAHATKDKTWGRIVILDGQLDYVVDDLNDLRFELSKGVDGIIAPRMLHRVQLVGPVEFYVEFYTKPEE